MKLKLGNFDREIEFKCDLATALEFVLIWSESSDDTVELLRLNAASIGVALDSFSMLPKYKPEKDKISVYGRTVLSRLLESKVSTSQIYESGSKILSAMMEMIP